MNRIQVSERV